MGKTEAAYNDNRLPRQRAYTWIERWLPRLLVFPLALYIASQFCYVWSVCTPYLSVNVFCTYVASGLILACLLWDRVERHQELEQEHRLVDPSRAKALLVQADDYYLAYAGSGSNDSNDGDDEDRDLSALSEDASPDALKREVDRLKDIPYLERNEYEFLQLEELLVPFWGHMDLIESAREYLSELGDYAQDSKFRYDWQQVNNREARVNSAIEKLEEHLEEAAKKDETVAADDYHARRLRAMVIGLLEHIREYQYSWAIGSATIRALTIYECMATGVLLFMGLLPLLLPEAKFSVINWAALGVAGALTAALQALRQEQAIEVGYSEGKQEIRKGMLGAVLGLVAGITVYALVHGGLLDGGFFPGSAAVAERTDVAKSIFWAIAAGYSFESVFERLRSASSNFT